MDTIYKNESTNKTKTWSKVTRWLHALIALSIVIQLILSLILVPPDEFEGASSLAKIAMEGHEFIGLIAATLLFFHWLWIFSASSDIKLANLFPLSRQGIQKVKSEIAYVFERKALPPAGEHGGMAGLIHGLGILIASGVALTGVGLYIVMDSSAQGLETPVFEIIAEIHELFGNLMWIYLVAHVLAAGWHENKGDRIISRMFRL